MLYCILYTGILVVVYDYCVGKETINEAAGAAVTR